jgi:predicted dehydrogenase
VKPRVPPDSGVPFSGHWKAAEHFVNVLRGEEELIVRKEQVLNVMRALEGIYDSAAEGREIRLD